MIVCFSGTSLARLAVVVFYTAIEQSLNSQLIYKALHRNW